MLGFFWRRETGPPPTKSAAALRCLPCSATALHTEQNAQHPTARTLLGAEKQALEVPCRVTRITCALVGAGSAFGVYLATHCSRAAFPTALLANLLHWCLQSQDPMCRRLWSKNSFR